MKKSKVIFPWKLASGILDAVEDAAIELEDGEIDERINAFGYAKTSHSFPIFRISIWLLNQFDAENINVHYRFAFAYKLGSVFSMVISSEIRMEQNRNDDHREDAPHFMIKLCLS